MFDYVYGDRTRTAQPRTQGLTGVHRCERCLYPFDARMRLSGKLRDSVEYEPLRAKLMLTPDVDPVLCDGCFVDVMTAKTPAPMSDGMPGSNTPAVLRSSG